MTKLYEFQEVSYWENPGCSCCNPTFMEGYNCISHQDAIYWTCHSVEDCMVATLLNEGNLKIDDETIYNMSENELIDLCNQNNIQVHIEGDS